MGVSTDAMLVYGYDLGDPEEWKVRELDTFDGGLAVGWYDHEDDEADFIDQAAKQLRSVPGAGRVEVVSHCSHDYPMYILAAHHITSHRGWVGRVDLPALVALQGDADARLARALDALGLTPTQDAPAWLLVSDWS